MPLVFNANGPLGAGWYATAGNDSETSAVVSATIFALGGNDSITGGTGNDTLWGGAGNDTLNGGQGNDVLYGEGDNDSLLGGLGNDTLDGGSGNDTLNGQDGEDSMTGGAGNDTYYINNSLDVVVEAVNGGIDTVIANNFFNLAVRGLNVENLTNSDSGNFVAIGNTLNNSITGGAGNDDLSGAEGNDTLTGGQGNDVLEGEADDDSLVGGAGNDRLFGDQGNDTLNGGDNNDSLDGGTGNDSLIGGFGDDTYVVDSILDVVVEASASGIDTIQTTLTSYNLAVSAAAVENLTYTGALGFTGTGTSANNVIIGGSFADSLSGAAGNDSLYGGNGNDTLAGGENADLLDGGLNFDIVDYTSSSAAVTVNLASGSGSAGDALGDILVSIEGVTGSTFDDKLTGSAFAENLSGGNGNDVLEGAGGADTLNGGFGDDRFLMSATQAVAAASVVGDAGTDTVEIGGSNVTVNGLWASGSGLEALRLTGTGVHTLNLSGVSISSSGFAGGMRITAEAASGLVINNANVNVALNVTGTSGGDTLRGGFLIDTIDGGAGKDTLYTAESAVGGTGDTLLGGIDDDTFIIGSGGSTGSHLGQLGLADGGAGNDILSLSNGDNLTTGLANVTNMEQLLVGFAIGSTLTLTPNAANAFTGKIVNVAGTGGGNIFVNASSFFADSRMIAVGAAGLDIITGGAGNDVFNGAGGTDILVGNGGDDDFVFATASLAANAGTISGGTGVDRVVITGDNQTVSTAFGNSSNLEQIALTGAGEHTVSFGISNAFSNGRIELLAANASKLTISNTLNSVNTVLVHGTGGDDLLRGTFNADTLIGGEGRDEFFVVGGADQIFGDGGDDILHITASNALAAMASADGGAGMDVLAIESVQQTATSLAGFANFELLRIGQVDNGAGVVLLGGAEEAFSGNVMQIEFLGGGNLEAIPLTKAMQVTGSAGREVVFAGSGNDTIDGGVNSGELGDIFQGGLGDDTYFVRNANDEVVEFENAGTDTVWVSANEWAANTYVEYIRLQGNAVKVSATVGNQQIFANALLGSDLNAGDGNDLLWGGAQADTLLGGSGDDLLWGGEGADILDGGTSDLDDESNYDVARYDFASTGVLARLDGGAGSGEAAGDTFINIDGLYGSAFGDVLVGNDFNNVLLGLDGDDALYGLGGNDYMIGGLGNDMFWGGEGADAMLGEDGFDIARYDYAASGVLVRLDGGANSGEATGDSFSGIEALIGSAFGDVLVGDNLNNVLLGQGGNDAFYALGGDDWMFGGDGDDQFWGGEGADKIYGDDGFDVARYDYAVAGVVARLDGGVGFGEAAGDFFAGIEALYGSGFGDLLIGDDGSNLLYGHDGADVLYGQGGTDYLVGGSGADYFAFGGGASFGDDVVLDYASVAAAGGAHDFIDFRGAVGLNSLVISAAGADTLITTNLGTITLAGVDATTLVFEDFLF